MKENYTKLNMTLISLCFGKTNTNIYAILNFLEYMKYNIA